MTPERYSIAYFCCADFDTTVDCIPGTWSDNENEGRPKKYEPISAKEYIMKKFTAVTLLAMGLAASGMAAEFKGFVEDTKCSTNPAMKDDAECAQKCIKGGSPAVLVGEDGKIYKIANQAKIVDHAGQKVVVQASLKGDTLTIDSVN